MHFSQLYCTLYSVLCNPPTSPMRPLALFCLALLSLVARAADAPLTYVGTEGPGKGKKVVLIANDHEYKSEEALPQLARILAKHHGYTCTVLFGIDPKNGVIAQGNPSNIPGTEALKDADLLVIFTRFQAIPAEQMQPIIDYLNRGGAVIGLRTATHGFRYPKDSPLYKYSFDYKGADYQGGFGRQILGETWVDHYGGYRSQSTLGIIPPDKKEHPILRGIGHLWGPGHAYAITTLSGDSQPLVLGQPLAGKNPIDAPDPKKPPVPVAWTKTFTGTSGKSARVFTTTMGAASMPAGLGAP